MNIIEPSFKLLIPEDREEGIEMLQTIERFARISHRTEEKQTYTSWERFIKSVVMEHGDWSVVEHVYSSVVLRVNRGVTHEQIRHRLFGYTQESTRFVNYTKPGFHAEYIRSCMVKPEDIDEWDDDFAVADGTYRKWLARGYAPQIARDHLPNGLASTIAVTGNLRNWRHAMIMRTTKETHPDFKCVTIPLLVQFKERVPLLFDDVVAEERQIDAMRKPR